MSNGGGHMNQYPFTYSTYSNDICMICDELKENGVQIHHHFICTHCEKEMINLQVHTDLYSYFVQKLKKLSF